MDTKAAMDIGRILHYVERNGECSAAFLTRCHSETEVDLRAFPNGTDETVHHTRVYKGTGEPGTWHWFGRQPDALHSAEGPYGAYGKGRPLDH